MPEYRWSYNIFVREFKKQVGQLEQQGKLVVCCQFPALKCPLQDGFNQHLKRLDLSFAIGPSIGVWEDSIRYLKYLYSHDKQAVDDINKIFDLVVPMLEGLCRHGAKAILGTLTGIMNMGAEKILPSWKLLCYWETLYGFEPKSKEVLGSVKEWLSSNFTHTGKLFTDEEYADQMALELREFLHNNWRMPSDVISYDNWIRSGMWMEGRSGDGRPTDFYVDGERVHTRRMKGIDSVFLSDKDAASLIKSFKPEVLYVMEKSEPTKSRPVIKTSNNVNRQMAYLSEYLERGLANVPVSPIFCGKAGMEAMDKDILAHVCTPGLWGVPLDQSKFDRHQSKTVIRRMIEEIGLFLWDFLSEDARVVFSSMYRSLFDCKVNIVLEGNVVAEWTSGLPSGWRWTGILGTLLNICSFGVINKIVAQSGLPLSTKYYALGDDLVFFSSSLESIEAVMTLYPMLNYEVHPKKTFVSKSRVEFLRKLYTPSGIAGYGVRTLLSLRFKNPISATTVCKPARLYARLVLWDLVRLRGAYPQAVVSSFLEDARQIGVSAVDAASFAVTPMSFGGGGIEHNSCMARLLAPYTDGWRTFKLHVQRKTVSTCFGQWGHRLKEYNLRGEYVERFAASLALSWGVPESRLYGKVIVEFVKVEQVTPRVPIPIYEDVSYTSKDVRDRYVPRLLKGIWLRQKISDGTWRQVFTPEKCAIYEKVRSRVSTRVFHDILAGEIGISVPLVDYVSQKYGLSVKRQAQDILNRSLAFCGCSTLDVKRMAYWLELYIARNVTRMYNGYVVAY